MGNKNNSRKVKVMPGLIIPAVVFCIIVIGAGIYSWCHHPDQFWSYSIANCLTLLVAVMLSFFYAQRQAAIDRNQAELRKQKDAAIRLLEALEQTITTQSAYVVTKENGSEQLTMTKRRMSNYIETIKKNVTDFGIDKEISFIEERFKEYSDLIGNHIDDLEHLERSQKDLLRPLELIQAKIYDAIFALCK